LSGPPDWQLELINDIHLQASAHCEGVLSGTSKFPRKIRDRIVSGKMDFHTPYRKRLSVFFSTFNMSIAELVRLHP
jgi:hypothetical protein